MHSEMEFSPSDPVAFLANEFSTRSKRNPRYSLRAFAKTLGISHSLLSLVLSGKRPVSKKLLLRLEEEMGLPQEKHTPKNVSFNQITLDTFALLADWYHYAILNLLEIPRTPLNEKTISQRLDISRADAGMALLRLERLGLIKKEKGQWKRCSAPLMVENKISTAATRKHHKQVLEKALDSLENDPFEIRDFSSVTFAVDPKLIPLARKKIMKFRRELMQELESKGNQSEVYHLAVQIYPVSKQRGKA